MGKGDTVMNDRVFYNCLEVKTSLSGTGKPFWDELAKRHGYKNGNVLRLAFNRERKVRGIKSKTNADVGESTTYQEGNGYINIICSSERVKSKEDIIAEFNIDTDKWHLDSFEVKTSEGYRKDRQVEWDVEDQKVIHGKVRDSGKMLIVPLYHVKAKFVEKTLEHLSLEDVEKVFEKKEFLLPNLLKLKYAPSDEVLEVNVMDLHFGSDANHSPEKRFANAIDDVVERVGKRSFEKIYLALLGDIYHYDNMNRTTSAGTVVTTNGLTPYEIVDMGVDVLITNILKLVEIAPLEVIFVPGNHDPMSGYALIKVIEAYFKDEEKIIFDATHKSRKYRLLGKSLVGWMHGDMPKNRAMSWLQVEASHEWGEALYREIHSGNFHSQSGKEDGGVILRYLPGMTDIDEWHYNKGYVGAVRALTSFVWHKEMGLREQWFTNITG